MQFSHETLSLPRAIAPGEEIVAIGDIHGRSDLLEALLDEAAAAKPSAPRRLVFTGDLIDRGPDSVGAMRLAAEAGPRVGADATVALMGNHEILMRLAVDPQTPDKIALSALKVWLGNGGDTVIEELLGARAEKARRTLESLRAATPPWILAWLASLVPNYRSGDALFVHAGVHPKIPLDDFLATPWNLPLDRVDERAHWAWIRGPFLDYRPDSRGYSGLFVVHGHTPLDRGHTRAASEQVARFRLNLDGGSAMTGQAKMALLRGGLAQVITASA